MKRLSQLLHSFSVCKCGLTELISPRQTSTASTHSFILDLFMNQCLRVLTLSTYAWDKQINIQIEIKWNIIKKLSVYKPGNFYCDLCLSEKLCIIKKNANNPYNINKGNDI